MFYWRFSLAFVVALALVGCLFANFEPKIFSWPAFLGVSISFFIHTHINKQLNSSIRPNDARGSCLRLGGETRLILILSFSFFCVVRLFLWNFSTILRRITQWTLCCQPILPMTIWTLNIWLWTRTWTLTLCRGFPSRVKIVPWLMFPRNSVLCCGFLLPWKKSTKVKENALTTTARRIVSL